MTNSKSHMGFRLAPNLVHGFVWRMTNRRTKISPKIGRGLGHVTPTIFGSTVGYFSDSLASCYVNVIGSVYCTACQCGVTCSLRFSSNKINKLLGLHLDSIPYSGRSTSTPFYWRLFQNEVIVDTDSTRKCRNGQIDKTEQEAKLSLG